MKTDKHINIVDKIFNDHFKDFIWTVDGKFPMVARQAIKVAITEGYKLHKKEYTDDDARATATESAWCAKDDEQGLPRGSY